MSWLNMHKEINLFKSTTTAFSLFGLRDKMIINLLPQGTLVDVLWIQEESHISQFLMNLRPKSEAVCAALP